MHVDTHIHEQLLHPNSVYFNMFALSSRIPASLLKTAASSVTPPCCAVISNVAHTEVLGLLLLMQEGDDIFGNRYNSSIDVRMDQNYQMV